MTARASTLACLMHSHKSGKAQEAGHAHPACARSACRDGALRYTSCMLHTVLLKLYNVREYMTDKSVTSAACFCWDLLQRQVSMQTLLHHLLHAASRNVPGAHIL